MRKTFLTAAVAAAFCFAGATLAVAQAPEGKKPGCCAADAPAGCGMNAEQQKAHKERMAGMKDEKTCHAYMEETRGKMGCGKEGHAMGKDMEHGCDHLKKKS
jgi:hypothetical protein